MTCSTNSRPGIAGTLVGIFMLAFGFSAAGSQVSFSLGNSTVPVYDLSGSYQFAQKGRDAGGAPIDLVLNLNLAEDAAGRLQGSGSANIQIGADACAATYVVQGRISGGGKITRATMVARWVGTGTGTTPPFSLLAQYNLSVRQNGLSGTARYRGTIGKALRASNTAVLSVPLPPGRDGSWGLQMSLTEAERLNGAGSIVVKGGRSVQTGLIGSLSRSGLARARLSGLGTDRASALSVSFFPKSLGLQSLSGRVLGQTVNLKLPTPLSGTGSLNLGRTSGSAGFAGMQACVECHGGTLQAIATTPHTTAGVHCENCHGAAAAHAANYYDPVTRPTIPLNGESCGTCHTGPQQPIYEEWTGSAHATLTQGVDPNNPSCAQCHLASVRLSLLGNQPLLLGDTNTGAGCTVCHEVHAEHTFANVLNGSQTVSNAFSGRSVTFTNTQLGPVYSGLFRSPLGSTNDYFVAGSTLFTNNYDPNLNLCAQCHNHRGASWDSVSRPPHSSLQYNMLLGTVGEMPDGSPPKFPAEHSRIEKQCVACHMQSSPAVSNTIPAVTGHGVQVTSFNACVPCHGPSPGGLTDLVQGIVTNEIQMVTSDLRVWAGTKADARLAPFGTNAWEYINAGALSPRGSGPNTTDLQALIPETIQKARFNLYLVFNDGSLGIHNPFFALNLLQTADQFVQQALAAPSD